MMPGNEFVPVSVHAPLPTFNNEPLALPLIAPAKFVDALS
jgi:hypothetical protein